MNIPITDWKWSGYPAHFCGAGNCRFRMATVVGNRVVSTVGDYWPDGEEQPQEIGLGRKYETMVFALAGYCDCDEDCGRPRIDPRELMAIGCNRPRAAAENHIKACHAVANGETQ